MSGHEDFDREEEMASGSAKSFGLALAGFFLIVGALKVFRGAEYEFWFIAAGFFLITAFFLPGILGPLSRLWFKFGALLHRVTTPLIMAVLFYGAVLPTGLFVRLCRMDPLRLRRRPDAASYWIMRTPPGPPPSGLRDQF